MSDTLSNDDAARAAATELAEKIAALSAPGAYPRAADPVDLLQTHISVLFFTAERVYKLKKPVRLEFLDYRALADRRRYCDEEVRLNRRLAPDVYLGVLPVTRDDDGGIRIDGAGTVVDWVVEMVRLPAERMLDALLARDVVGDAELARVAGVLAEFHAGAATGPEVDAHGRPARIAEEQRENVEQLRHACDAAGEALLGARGLDFVLRFQERFLAEHRALLQRRVAERRIREGHGDLHAGNICLIGARVLVYDCVEFDGGLRCGDVASDLAFLAMDLDHRDHGAASERVVRAYAERANDPELVPLVAFYELHRALVRAKVQLLTAQDRGLDEPARAAALRAARSYAQLALGYALPPALVLLCGLPGSGKSHLARHVASRLRAASLRSDDVRREESASDRYSDEARRAVYERMEERARAALAAGRSAAVDATFARRAFRAPFLALATELGVPLFVLHVEVDEDEVRRRMRARAHDRGEPSEADFDVYRAERERFEPPAEVSDESRLALDGTRPPEELGARLMERMVDVALARDAASHGTPNP